MIINHEQVGLLLSAKIFFLFGGISFIIFIITSKVSEKKEKILEGRVKGKILEIIRLRITDLKIVYQYTVNNHVYIGKPLILKKNSHVNQKYTNSENCTCIPYLGRLSQTKYKEGENIEIAYHLQNPEKHCILQDKDKILFQKLFKIGGSIFFLLSMIFVIAFFCKK